MLKTNTSKNYSGMRYKLILSFAGLLILSVFMVLTANRGSLRSLTAYRDFANYYQELSDFYRNMETAESAAKAYLYDKSKENMNRYRSAVQEARLHLSDLINLTENESSREEYRKLEHMVETYDSLFSDIRNSALTLHDGFGFFTRLPSNIQATYISYTEMITKDMKSEYLLIYTNLKNQITMIMVIICLMIIFAVTGAWISIHSITRPITRLVENVQKIKKKEYQIPAVKSGDIEIQLLANAIIEMADSIQENLDYVEERVTLEKILLQQENENLKMNELLIDTKLKVLQDQMNPHFLFNTLNLITKMAYLENAHRTSGLMEKTADLLRYSLDKSNSSSDLWGELECIKNYIRIQEVRFGHRIQFYIRIEENLPNAVMPGMIIQPLVENAVSHGVKDMMVNACIIVCAVRKADKVHIIVEDNGAGMESERMEQIMSDREIAPVPSNGERAGIGLSNVMMRLEMFYGEEGIMNIESSKNCGTVITVMIPIAEEKEYV